MTMTKIPKSVRPNRPMTMRELQAALKHVMLVLLHKADRLTLSESESSYHYDAVQAALAGSRPAPYASMDDREEPDDDDGPASLPSQRRQGGDK